MKKVNIVRTDNGTLSTDTINAMVAECIKAYPSNTQLKANKADIITTFGISDKDYIEVVKAVKAYRLETLAVEVSHIKNDVLTFENWLSKGWEMLSKDNAFNSMMIRYQSVKAKDYSLSSFVYDFYSFILLGCNESDPTIVKPVWRYRLNDSNEIERIRVYEIADTTKLNAERVLANCFKAFAKASKKGIKTLGYCPTINKFCIDSIYGWQIQTTDLERADSIIDVKGVKIGFKDYSDVTCNVAIEKFPYYKAIDCYDTDTDTDTDSDTNNVSE